MAVTARAVERMLDALETAQDSRRSVSPLLDHEFWETPFERVIDARIGRLCTLLDDLDPHHAD